MACGCGYRKRLREDRKVRSAVKNHYLDCCATTPVDPRTLGAFERACRENWGNPSSAHARGIAAADFLDHCRSTLGAAFSAKPEGVFFCASGSEALHAGLWGLAARYPKLRFVTTATEHASIGAPLRLLRALGRDVEVCRADSNGYIDQERLRSLLRPSAPRRGSSSARVQLAADGEPRTVFAYSAVNHETGAIQNAREIWSIVRESDALAFIDAVQAAPRLPASEWAPYAHLFAVSAHKLYAPKGSAFLWKTPELRLRSFRYGGGQEGGLFPGTENVPGIAAFAEGATLLEGSFREETMALRVLEKEFFADCERRGIEMHKESPENHAPGVFCVGLPWASDMETFMTNLARAGLCVSRFSACSDRIDGPSKTLLAMGRGREEASRSLRVGLGRFNVREDVIALAKALEAERKKALRP